MRTFRTGAIVAAAAIALAGIGCGGGDEESTMAEAEAEQALTKEEFITQADQICADGDAELEQAFNELDPDIQPSDEEATTFITDTVLPNLHGQADAIGELPAPEGDEEQVDEIVTALNSAIDEAEADPTGAITGGKDTFAEVNTLAQDYGLTKCGNG